MRKLSAWATSIVRAMPISMRVKMMCGWSFVAVVFCCASAAASVTADYEGGRRIDLSGLWDFRLDAAGAGDAGRWFAGNDPRGWRKLAVPDSFNEQLARNAAVPRLTDTMRFYQGAAWYRTRFRSPRGLAANHMLCYLHLSGTVLRHSVWLNGVKLGDSVLPYLDAGYNATPLLMPDGRNTLVIKVDNSIQKRAIPDANWHGWWDDGGLIRPVYLEIRPATNAQSYVITTMEGRSGWRLAIDTRINNTRINRDGNGAVLVTYTLKGADGTVVWHSPVHRVKQDELKSEAVLPDVLPWAPEHPALYTLTTEVSKPSAASAVDVTTVHVGFRQIEVVGTQIMLNGAPLTVLGINRHEFLAGAGMSLSPAQNRKDIAEIKALGANFVRLAHYSQSQDVYDACDQLGLLVWTEIPAWQTDEQTLADPAVWTEYAQPQLEQMVKQHRNHPSVVMWSVANEIPTETPAGAAYVARAIAYVKTLDRTRLVTFASDRREKDTAFGAVDVIAVNEYFGWYYGLQQDVGPMLDTLHSLFPQKPILVSEFGDEAVRGWNRDPAEPEARDYSDAGQAAFLETHMSQIYAPQRRAFMAGGLIWVFNDFPDPHQDGADRPESALYCNTKGIVTMTRERKSSFVVVQAFYNRLQLEQSKIKQLPTEQLQLEPSRSERLPSLTLQTTP